MLRWIGEVAVPLPPSDGSILPCRAAEQHAFDRLSEGFDLVQVVTEFRLLREVLFELWEDGDAAAPPKAARSLDRAIDAAICSTVEHYVAMRDRTLQAVDRVSSAALESRTIDTDATYLAGSTSARAAATVSAVACVRTTVPSGVRSSQTAA